MPRKISWKGNIAKFEGVCPITKDTLYTGTRESGDKFSVIVTNPEARYNQNNYFARTA